jgi:predicted GH43/DUF377 family glycosyl hydrolase
MIEFNIEKHEIVRRYKKNPIITTDMIPERCNTVFNAGAIKHNNEYILLIRVEMLENYSQLYVARSKNGYDFKVDSKPLLFPSKTGPFSQYENLGIEDPRITKIDKYYYITYTAYSQYDPLVSLARTKNFITAEKMGPISLPSNKDCVLFPEKINGRYARLDRPMSGYKGNIWISFSDDLEYWGDYKVVLSPRWGKWDPDRIGAGAVPIKTDYGWLEIYHGVKNTSKGGIYKLGVVLLDLEKPEKVIGRSNIPILTPKTSYERIGDIGNVVFTCGVIKEDDDTIKIYYGAADSFICIAETEIKTLIELCFTKNGRDKEQ